MSGKVCDNTSVGVIVRHSNGKILLIERKKGQLGLACPAGHVDDHGGFRAAARAELEEEVGLTAKKLKEVYRGIHQNPCRRKGGDHHQWVVYIAEVEDHNVIASEDETKGFRWVDAADLASSYHRSQRYMKGEISEEAWSQDPGLEPIWAQLFEELDFAGVRF